MDKLNLASLSAASTQDGKDPEILKNAVAYSTRDYQMTVEPLLESLVTDPELTDLLVAKLVGAGDVNAEIIQAVLDTDEFHAIVQKTMQQLKYAVLENSSDNKEAAADAGLLIPRRRKQAVAEQIAA